MKRDAATFRSRLADLLTRCREERVAATPQRLAVYRALLESEEHPTPEALFRRVREEMPSLSLATIYKALHALEKLGVVRELTSATHGRRFDANVERHHHLLCTRCRKVADYYDRRLDALRPPRRVAGFTPHGVSVQIVGLCGECSAGARRRRKRRRAPTPSPARKES